MLNKIWFTLVFVALNISVQAQYSEYSAEVYVSKQGDSLLYRQLNPKNIEKGKKYPLVLFLHGAGERGSDNTSQLVHGGMMFTNPVNREKYPCFAIFPQCPAESYWPHQNAPIVSRKINPFG